MANNYWNSYEEKKWPSFSSLNDFFVKKGEDFPFCNFQEPWKNGDGKWTPRWEIFYEEGLYLKKKVTHIFSTKLFLKQKISVVEKEEEEDEEMIWDLFNVMALEDDISGDDYVNMIYATPRGKGKQVESNDTMGGNTKKKKTREKTILDQLLESVPGYNFINEEDSNLQYSDVTNFMITYFEIEKMNEHPEKEGKHIQNNEGNTIVINLGTNRGE